MYLWAAAGKTSPKITTENNAKQKGLRRRLRMDDASVDLSAGKGDIVRGVMRTTFSFYSSVSL